ncbi:unnamed protein product [Cyclocybe aegerita]|uniref:Bromo domain-containing protein n=1 Tax=Cyclocybe aegerita TaxID=1973307 RepID=A0A8S0WAH7_CYCAE|nr:unnamed protein product [Cyclocybe aegerita]
MFCSRPGAIIGPHSWVSGAGVVRNYPFLATCLGKRQSGPASFVCSGLGLAASEFEVLHLLQPPSSSWPWRMNNLLRTLTESQVKPAADLRLLLTSVKEARRQSYDTKLADPFYDSLEGLLVDLKTITIDNRDAEAFLKPVSRAEVPDYYDVISNPMDFQTMLKKIKQKQYKSKREFKDDLDLIWSNCYTYNASENHPLRQCANRLRVKAERLLMHITDRKERWDPAIPSDLPSPTGVARVKINGTNGHMNGRSSHTRSPSLPQPSTPTSALAKHSYTVGSRLRHGTSFQDSPAIVRTPEGMATFRDLDAQTGSFQPSNTLASTLRDMAITVEYESDSETPVDDSMAVDGQAAGDKRKSNGANHRPRKRARYTVPYATPIPDERNDVSQLWWGAVQSDALLANGLPGIPFGPSCSTSHKRKAKRTKPPKRVKEEPPSNPKSLLVMMNANIKTMRRVRHTHAKFAAMNAATAPPEEDENGETPAPGYGTGMVVGQARVRVDYHRQRNRGWASVWDWDWTTTSWMTGSTKPRGH